MSFTDANRQFFDSISDTYDSKPHFQVLNQKVTDYLRTNIDWIDIPSINPTSSSTNNNEVRQLDYACGTGLMSRIFAPYTTTTLAIDLSPKMVSTFNTRAQASSLPPSRMHATTGDLLSKSEPNPTHLSGQEYHGFDLVTAGFALHHFEDPIFAARQLKERLRPGGVFLSTDFLEGGDLKADEQGNMVEGEEGDFTGHFHAGHGQEHGHGHHHGHHHHHQHHKDQNQSQPPSQNETQPHNPTHTHQDQHKLLIKPHFTRDGVRQIYEAAGFVDIDVRTLPEKTYLEMGGAKVYRTVLFGRGRRPVEEGREGKSEL